MANPWVSVQKLAVVPTFNTQFDTSPVLSDWDSLIMQRVVYDPDPVTGAGILERIAEIDEELSKQGVDTQTRKDRLKKRGQLMDQAKQLGCL